MIKFTRAIAVVLALTASTMLKADDDHPAQTMVVDTVNAMLAVYEEEGERLKSDPEFLQKKIDELVIPRLDFDTMTKLAVSKFWRRADKEQQVELVDEFTTLLLNTYTSAFAQYSGGGETVEFEPFRAEKRDDRAVVRSIISQSAGDAVPVVYKLRDKNGWSIYDIEVDSVSLVTSYRSAFSSEIERNGIDGLIKTLKERNNKS